MQMQRTLGQCSSVIITFILLSSYTVNVFFILNISVLGNQCVTIMFLCMLSGYKNESNIFTYVFVHWFGLICSWTERPV